MSELDELLARAIELEQKAVEAGDGDDLGDLAADVDELAADAGGLDVNEPSLAEQQEWDDFDVNDELAAEDLDDEPAGVDFDEPDDEPEEKAAGGWGPCPLCGSTDRDEFDDGTARCSECGGVLERAVAKKHFDFDDLEPDEPVEVKSGLDTMDEMDLLRARRLELEG
jgi:hypothetical protein